MKQTFYTGDLPTKVVVEDGRFIWKRYRDLSIKGDKDMRRLEADYLRFIDRAFWGFVVGILLMVIGWGGLIIKLLLGDKK